MPELDLLSPEPEPPNDGKAWHVPAAERPLKGGKKEKTEYAEVDLGDGRTARMKI